MPHADPHKGIRPVLARAEPQGGPEMPYCEIELPGPQPEPAALLPTASESRVDRQSTIDQGDGGVNVFAEVSEHVCGIGEDLRVVTCNPNGSPRKIDSGMTARLRKLGPPVTVEI